MKRLSAIFAAVAALLLAPSCEKVNPAPEPEDGRYDRVVIMCAAAFNNLTVDVRGNFDAIAGQTPNPTLPECGSKDAFIILEHCTAKNSNYKIATSPLVVRMRRDFLGRPVRDTLATLETGALLTEKETLGNALKLICDRFPSDHYGLIYSSHGTGWLPQGYYDNPVKSESVAPQSLGVEVEESGKTSKYLEMDIKDFAQALPVHFDYIILDACLMGGIEVAYELKDRTDAIVFSATEIMSSGFEYSTIVSHLLNPGGTDLEAICREYYELYVQTEGSTVACIDCSGLDALADLCAVLFDKYRTAMAGVDPESVQGFFREDHHYFYDLADIFLKAGASDSDLAALASALGGCVRHKYAAKKFLSIKIDTFCGLSMYLPCDGYPYLDKYYRTLAWNKATGLVK